MRVCCTRPRQANESNWPHINEISDDELLQRNDESQAKLADLKCKVCGMPLMLGDCYLPIQHIGTGGFGCTFLAVNFRARTRKRVLKQFRSDRFVFQEQLRQATEKFQQEAEVLDTLNHPRIPRATLKVKIFSKH
jgi:serine/threonine protein kinase